MPRIRSIKPDFFKDEDLACLPFEARLFFAGLWCYADKAGRLEMRQKYLKAEIFPYDDVDVAKLIKMLEQPQISDRPEKSFLRIYTVKNRQYIEILEFSKHQCIHHTEKESVLPQFNGEETVSNGCLTSEYTHEHIQIIDNSKQIKNRENEAKLKESFLIFWSSYPRKVAKIEAEKAWMKLKVTNGTLKKILDSLEIFKKSESWTKQNGQFIPYPASWLNNRRWEDEFTVKQNTDSRKPKNYTQDKIEAALKETKNAG